MTTDESMKEIAKGCDRCARCNTEILPGQRTTGDTRAVIGSRMSSQQEHESREDCVDALLNMVSGEPPWRGRERSIIEALGRKHPLADYDIVTGRFDT